MLRMDKGTENSLVGVVHYAMREDGDDCYSGEKSIRYGTSPIQVHFYRESRVHGHNSGDIQLGGG